MDLEVFKAAVKRDFLKLLDKIREPFETEKAETEQAEPEPIEDNTKLYHKIMSTVCEIKGHNAALDQRIDARLRTITAYWQPYDNRLRLYRELLVELTNEPTFIRNSIVGHWQNVSQPSQTVSIKISDDEISIKWDHSPYYTSTFNEDQGGYRFTVVGNRVKRQQWATIHWVCDWFVEGEFLVKWSTLQNYPVKFKRIGEPL